MLRFAPSPTGEMHIDSLQVAIFNYLVSRQRNEPFLVRIDDTDKTRVIEGKDSEIMQILGKFALIHDQVYHQSEHLHIHQTLAIRLLEEKKAFICTCTPDGTENTQCSGKCESIDNRGYAKLKESGEPFVIRLKKPDETVIFHDVIQGKQTALPHEVDSFVILNADATPASDFATACDDMLSNISLIIREERHLSKTFRQIHIKQALGYLDDTHYAHLPKMLNQEGVPMSDTDAPFTLKWLFEQGFIPDAIMNYLILLVSPTGNKEVFYFSEALEWFTLENITDAPMKFDMEKLRFLNREHLKMMDDKLLSSLFGFADADIGKLAKIYLKESSTINELAADIRPILAPKVFKGKWEEPMRQIQQVLVDAPMFDTFEELKAYVISKTNLDKNNLMQPLRLLLTGREHGPELSTIYPYIKSYLLEVIS